jgi:prepilin-type processing-associated H-X9-DG protein
VFRGTSSHQAGIWGVWFSVGNSIRVSPATFSKSAVGIDQIKSSWTTIIAGDSVDWHLALNNKKWWTSTGNDYGYTSGHPDRHGKNANYLMGDGSVSALTPEVALAYLANPANPDL